MGVMIRSAFLATCLIFGGLIAMADQQAYITQAEAQRALELLTDANEIMHFCAPCGDEGPTPEIIEALDVAATGYESFYELKVNGNGVDLAYTYALIDGAWTNVAMVLGLEVIDVPRTLGDDTAAEGEFELVESTPRDFGMVHFAGMVGDKLSVFMALAQQGVSLEGEYAYAHVGESIQLSGEIDGDDNLTLNEMVEGEKTGKFVGKYDRAAGTITGQWMTPDGSRAMPFTLKRIACIVQESRIVQLSPPYFGEGDEGPWYSNGMGDDGPMIPQATVSGAMPFFLPADDDTASAINGEVRHAFDEFVGGGILEFAEGAAEFMGNPEEEWPMWLQFSRDMSFNRFYCYTPELISFTFDSYIYSGGAHGMYWAAPINLGLVDGDAVPLEFDKLFTDTAAAVGIISAYCVQDLKKQEASSVADGAITEFTAEDLGNFALSKKGITIFFAPYAVASYAEGAFQVTVPWTNLASLANKSILAPVLPE